MMTKNILIVEDEDNLASTLARALRLGSNGGFEVVVCESGEDALSRAANEKFDLVISDLRLPGIDGLEVIAQIVETSGNTRSILMTGYGSDEVKQRASKISDGYLPKPFDMLDLLVLVQRVIDKTGELVSAKKEGNGKSNDMGTKPQVLIMEDDPGLRRIYSKALTKGSFDVHLAPTVQEAREALENNIFNIFICDIHMGSERGTDLLTEYGDKLKENNTEVIMVSAYGQYRTLTEEMGADFFLEKPISLGTLITLIGRLINDNKDKVSLENTNGSNSNDSPKTEAQ
ncbi:MAG: response regulator [Chloroflexi bacterium]|nr:response regulator [Chloroflexota bacterium]